MTQFQPKSALLLSYLFILCIHLNSGSLQRYIVRGKLLCGSTPLGKVHVKLIDVDSPGYDDVMDEKFSNDDGEFLVDGQTEETTPIDPTLKIYHDCSDGLPCQRRWKMALPKKYIVKPGEQNAQNKTVDIGILNLEMHWHAEKRNCLTG